MLSFGSGAEDLSFGDHFLADLSASSTPVSMWIKKKSRKYDKYYFFDTETRESTWKRPAVGFELFHILIKHSESRNPNESLTKDQALGICKSIYGDLSKDLSENAFKQKAVMHSKCASAKRGRYLGMVVGEEMHKEFEKSAFSLEKNQMVGPVETISVFHLIYRK